MNYLLNAGAVHGPLHGAFDNNTGILKCIIIVIITTHNYYYYPRYYNLKVYMPILLFSLIFVFDVKNNDTVSS